MPNDEFHDGQIDARLQAVERRQDQFEQAIWVQVQALRADVTDIKVSLAGWRHIPVEHLECSGRISRLENSLAFSRGIVAVVSVFGAIFGAVATWIVTWIAK